MRQTGFLVLFFVLACVTIANSQAEGAILLFRYQTEYNYSANSIESSNLVPGNEYIALANRQIKVDYEARNPITGDTSAVTKTLPTDASGQLTIANDPNSCPGIYDTSPVRFTIPMELWENVGGVDTKVATVYDTSVTKVLVTWQSDSWAFDGLPGTVIIPEAAPEERGGEYSNDACHILDVIAKVREVIRAKGGSLGTTECEIFAGRGVSSRFAPGTVRISLFASDATNQYGSFSEPFNGDVNQGPGGLQPKANPGRWNMYVIAHEYGHWLQENQLNGAVPEGRNHFVNTAYEPKLALAEGWAAFISGFIFDESTPDLLRPAIGKTIVYTDAAGTSYPAFTIPADAAQGVDYDLETNQWWLGDWCMEPFEGPASAIPVPDVYPLASNVKFIGENAKYWYCPKVGG